ncbi:MAG: efflux RND transporter permease subunit [Planctomycetota bacterium]|nr:MAG: efflux RND transporter permease subunit [Planctomycetota bacterium]
MRIAHPADGLQRAARDPPLRRGPFENIRVVLERCHPAQHRRRGARSADLPALHHSVERGCPVRRIGPVPPTGDPPQVAVAEAVDGDARHSAAPGRPRRGANAVAGNVQWSWHGAFPRSTGTLSSAANARGRNVVGTAAGTAKPRSPAWRTTVPVRTGFRLRFGPEPSDAPRAGWPESYRAAHNRVSNRCERFVPPVCPPSFLPLQMPMNWTETAVRRPVATLMVCVIVALMGVESLARLALDLMPDITYPVITVITLYEGAGPEEIETLITRPIEQAVSAVQGVDRLYSSSQEGASEVRIRFDWGVDLDGAIADLRARLERARSSLPEDAQPPFIYRYDVADFPIMYLGLITRLDPIQATRLAEQVVAPRLERLDGVAGVRIRGRARREIQVALDHDRMVARGIGVNEVITALRRQNVMHPAGDVQEGHLRVLVRSAGAFGSLDEIRETVVRRNGSAVVRVRDIAEVIDGERERTELTRVDGQPGMMLYIYKQSGANTVAVSDRVHEAVAEINRTLSEGELRIRVDKADYIRAAVANVRQAAYWGIGLAVLVLLLFLRSLRSTLIIAITIPLAVLATFVLMYFRGFTLNIVSFGGLALGIGMLVDNAIVVLESISRRREEGQPLLDAAVEGTREVAAAVTASTLTTIIVFLPLVFIAGATGILLRQLAWVVSFSLVCSLAAGLTLTPCLMAHFRWPFTMRSKAATKDDAVPQPLAADRGKAIGTSVESREVGGFLGWMESGYAALLRACLQHRVGVAIGLFGLVAVAAGLAPRVPTEFLPKTDEGDLQIYGEMAPGIRLEELSRQTALLEEQVLELVPEAHTVAAFIGDDADDADEWNETALRITLVPRSQRKRSSEEIRRALDRQLRRPAGLDLQIRVRSDMVMGRMFATDTDLAVEIRGHDRAEAMRIAERVAAVMKTMTGLANVRIGDSDRRPELRAVIDRKRAERLGVAVEEITQALEATVGGTRTTVYREGGDEFDIRVWLAADQRHDPEVMKRVAIRTADGRLVPLRNFIRYEPAAAPLRIPRVDRQRVVFVTADVDSRDLGALVAALQQRLAELPVPPEFNLQIAGTWEQQQESFHELQLGFALAVLLMYMVMAAQFESLIAPLIILGALPLGGVGVVAILLLTGTSLNVQSFIGLIMLAGIVVNNAIVLVDYTNQLRRRYPQKSMEELLVLAGRRRLRPILMTTLTTVLAMLPIAVGWGEGGEVQAPMARVVIGGLLAGTLTTLVAIPTICAFVYRPQPAAVRPQITGATAETPVGMARV